MLLFIILGLFASIIKISDYAIIFLQFATKLFHIVTVNFRFCNIKDNGVDINLFCPIIVAFNPYKFPLKYY